MVSDEAPSSIEHGLPLFAAHRTFGLRAYVSDVGPSGIERGTAIVAAHQPFGVGEQWSAMWSLRALGIGLQAAGRQVARLQAALLLAAQL